jgi:hypothetical protein
VRLGLCRHDAGTLVPEWQACNIDVVERVGVREEEKVGWVGRVFLVVRCVMSLAGGWQGSR